MGPCAVCLCALPLAVSRIGAQIVSPCSTQMQQIMMQQVRLLVATAAGSNGEVPDAQFTAPLCFAQLCACRPQMALPSTGG
jgi:hypothetical protein